jgi:hypothetical protein
VRVIDLLHHDAIPIASRRRIQALSFEAEILALLGARIGGDDPRSRRLEALEREAVRLRGEAVPLVVRQWGGR